MIVNLPPASLEKLRKLTRGGMFGNEEGAVAEKLLVQALDAVEPGAHGRAKRRPDLEQLAKEAAAWDATKSGKMSDYRPPAQIPTKKVVLGHRGTHAVRPCGCAGRGRHRDTCAEHDPDAPRVVVKRKPRVGLTKRRPCGCPGRLRHLRLCDEKRVAELSATAATKVGQVFMLGAAQTTYTTKSAVRKERQEAKAARAAIEATQTPMAPESLRQAREDAPLARVRASVVAQPPPAPAVSPSHAPAIATKPQDVHVIGTAKVRKAGGSGYLVVVHGVSIGTHTHPEDAAAHAARWNRGEIPRPSSRPPKL